MATCGPSVAEEKEPAAAVVAARAEEAMLQEAEAGQHYTVGAVRTLGGLQGKILHSHAALQAVPNSAALRDFFNDHAAPYLKEGAAAKSPLAHRGSAESIFNDLKLRLDERARRSRCLPLQPVRSAAAVRSPGPSALLAAQLALGSSAAVAGPYRADVRPHLADAAILVAVLTAQHRKPQGRA